MFSVDRHEIVASKTAASMTGTEGWVIEPVLIRLRLLLIRSLLTTGGKLGRRRPCPQPCLTWRLPQVLVVTAEVEVKGT